MSGKDKLRKFRENETFKCLHQPNLDEVFNKNHLLKGNWHKEIFKNNNPIVLELGCGKGEYTIALAEKYPNKNFIGIDIKGARLWKGAKYTEENSIANIAFLRCRIEFIESLFGANEVSEIWITFADPQINRDRKRLTNPMFIKRYQSFLKKDGTIHLKTDSRYLHEYSVAMAEQNNMTILDSNKDIYGTGRADEILSVKTFYESQYLAKNIAITYMSFIPDNKKELIDPKWDKEAWEKQESER